MDWIAIAACLYMLGMVQQLSVALNTPTAQRGGVPAIAFVFCMVVWPLLSLTTVTAYAAIGVLEVVVRLIGRK